MFTSLEIENYRGFQRYRIRDLSRVNLLVGKNNSGKTSILEGIHLLASGGDPAVLLNTAWQRGELVFVEADERYRRDAYPVISHFFHGHLFEPGTSFRLRSVDGLGEITVRVLNLAELAEERAQVDRQMTLWEEKSSAAPTLGVRLEGAWHPAAREIPVLAATEEGLVLPEALYRYRRPVRLESRETARVQFISPDSLQPRTMTEMWNKVITEGRESEVVDAVRIIAPTLTDIVFLSGEVPYRYGTRAGILAAFEGSRRRDPLGSHGDGMRRLLALSLALIQSAGGVLLVDEIDTGLHYSVLGQMWQLVVEAARRTDVQVFATTHSSDCVRGLAWLCANHPQLREDVSLQKIDSDLEESVALDADQIVLAVNGGMEVR